MSLKQTKKVDFGRRSGLKVYPVSIGAMRLPDEEKSTPLMRQAIDAGMVYIDTCRGYGDSEIKVGKSLKDGYREKVILSTKWGPWNIKVDPDDTFSADCTYKRILESMQRLEVEYLDFYQVWDMSSPERYEQATCKGGMLDGIRRAMDERLVKHTGFTTHDTPENISRYIDEADWCEAILFTYNMMNLTYKDVIAKAHEEGIATIVMNPINGGMFAHDSSVLSTVTKKTAETENVIEAAHRYLDGNENVDTILCGIEKTSDITATLENYQKLPLTKKQMADLEAEMANISKGSTNFCTGCKYCMPCPQEINIPHMMDLTYYDKILKIPTFAQNTYTQHIKANKGPADCTQCGKCEQKCTQKLKIIDHLQHLAKKFG